MNGIADGFGIHVCFGEVEVGKCIFVVVERDVGDAATVIGFRCARGQRDGLREVVDRLGVVAEHDVVAIRLFDEQEMHLPKIGFIQLYNAETNERTWVNSNSPKIQKEFEEVFSKQIAATEKGFKRSGIDFTTIRTDQNFIRPLVELFHRR